MKNLTTLLSLQQHVNVINRARYIHLRCWLLCGLAIVMDLLSCSDLLCPLRITYQYARCIIDRRSRHLQLHEIYSPLLIGKPCCCIAQVCCVPVPASILSKAGEGRSPPPTPQQIVLTNPLPVVTLVEHARSAANAEARRCFFCHARRRVGHRPQLVRPPTTRTLAMCIVQLPMRKRAAASSANRATLGVRLGTERSLDTASHWTSSTSSEGVAWSVGPSATAAT